ncbi:hypothetical protein [Youngiibacter fragilis]|uniref:tRNA(Ile2) 2-agmatinylcytidine synthetase n=1 Tax=Youngiibacter fragilis 232.1 TaxID=994573 RepID=V7HZ18_9CLOT|nr:hypothetical protein [Youngiibacter fragilis]ETA79215.1 hypothetical protein T472_0218205 [Youngiibacter fragilis 232.1]
MKTIFCIDDTDNITSTRGTGELAAMLIGEIESRGWGKGGYIVRHQLFVHPDVPYTSHNSSMSFTLDVEEDALSEIIGFSGRFLEEMSEPGSDPGLCAAVTDKLNDSLSLIEFGKDAKCTVLTKYDAYSLADRLGIHLSEHGGTGMGVIGALAGVGLRLKGTDGRVRGKYFEDEKNQIKSVKDILSNSTIEVVSTKDGIALDGDEKVLLGEKVKGVYMYGRSVLLVCQNLAADKEAPWQTCPMEYIKSISG